MQASTPEQKALIQFNEGIKYFRAQDYDTARLYIDEAIKLNPYDPDFYKARGDCNAYGQYPVHAAYDYEIVLLFDPTRLQLVNEVKTRKQKYNDHYEQYWKQAIARELSERKQYYPNDCEESKKQVANNEIILADFLIELGKYTEALERLQSAAEAVPGSPHALSHNYIDFLLFKGLASLHLKDEKTAMQCFDKLKSRLVTEYSEKKSMDTMNLAVFTKVCWEIGFYYSKQGKSLLAISAFEEGINAVSIYSHVGSEESNSHYPIGFEKCKVSLFLEKPKIQKILDEALTLQAKAADAYFNGRYDESLQLCQQVISIYPRLPLVFLCLACIRFLKGQFAEALLQLNEYLKLKPEDELVNEVTQWLTSEKNSIDSQLATHKEWLKNRCKEEIAIDAIRFAITGHPALNEFPPLVAISSHSDMNTKKKSMLIQSILNGLNKSGIIGDNFNRSCSPVLSYKIAQSLQRFFTLDVKKTNHVHLVIKEKKIIGDPSLALSLQAAINDSRVNVERLSEVSLEEQAWKNVLKRIEDFSFQLQMKLHQEAQRQSSDEMSSQNYTQAQATRPIKKNVLSFEEDMAIRRTMPSADANLEVTRSPNPLNYGANAMHAAHFKPAKIDFGAPSNKKIMKAVGKLGETFVDGMQQLNDIDNGNYGNNNFGY